MKYGDLTIRQLYNYCKGIKYCNDCDFHRKVLDHGAIDCDILYIDDENLEKEASHELRTIRPSEEGSSEHS